VTTNRNAQVLREHLRKFVEKRIQRNKIDQKRSEEFDFLNHLLANRDAFPDVMDVVDTICDFFAAAAETTQSGTRTLLSYFIKNPKGLAKVRSQF